MPPVIPQTAPAGTLADLCDLAFEASFVRELPGDPLLHNVSRAVRNACYTRVNPTPVAAPRLLGLSEALGETLGIARPLTQLSGAPVSYPQYRSTLGLEVSF